MTIWFTSDSHFGHEKLRGFMARPFSSVEDMTEGLIQTWNSKVQPEDTVYHLGDFFWMSAKKAVPIIERLNGNKRWVRGNHDTKDHVKKLATYFEWIKDYHEEKFNFLVDGADVVQFVVMCHYPILSWNRMAHGSWMLHGHCHGSLGRERRARYDVGVDHNYMTPISLEELHRQVRGRYVLAVDDQTVPAAGIQAAADRALFEESVFSEWFIKHVRKLEKPTNPQFPFAFTGEDISKDELCKREGESYARPEISAMWFGWCKARNKLALPEDHYHQPHAEEDVEG